MFCERSRDALKNHLNFKQKKYKARALYFSLFLINYLELDFYYFASAFDLFCL